MKVSEAALRSDEHFTYGQYKTWPDDERWELIKGVAYNMSAPNTEHQRILRRLFSKMDKFLEGKPCELFVAPFDVIPGLAFELSEIFSPPAQA